MQEFLETLVSYWLRQADSGEAQPVDLRLAGLVYEYGIGGIEPNPANAKKWFNIETQTRQLARTRAAQERVEREQRLQGKIHIDIGSISHQEHSEYDQRVFDEELERHIRATVYLEAGEVEPGLSAKQKEKLAQFVIATFENLLSPAAAATLHLPEKPPELYATRKARDELGRKENVVEFVRRVYAKEIDAGIIALSDLSSLDRSGYNAIYSWNSLHQDNPFNFTRRTTDQPRQPHGRRFDNSKRPK